MSRGKIYKGKNGISFYEYSSWCHRYKVVVPNGETIYKKKKGYKTEEESDIAYYEHEREFKEQLKSQKKEIDKDITFKNYLTYWFEEIYSSKVEFSTEIVSAYMIYNLIFSNIDYDVKLSLVTTSYLDELLLKISKMVDYGAQGVRSILIMAFKFAVKKKIVTKNIALDTKTYPRIKPKIKILNTKQLMKFLKVESESNWYLEILLALFCGLRKGEILALKFSDFDLQNKTLRIERQLVKSGKRIKGSSKVIENRLVEHYPKTSNSFRTIRVPNLVLEELSKRSELVNINKQIFQEKYVDNDYVSCGVDGRPHSLTSLNAHIKKVCNDLSLPHITVHALRHMCATILLENSSINVGENLAKISAFLGHQSIHTTFKYYCEVMDDDEKILLFMNNLFDVNANA